MLSEEWLKSLDGEMQAQFRFLMVADRLKSVLRANVNLGGARRENSAEHSWYVCLFAVVLRQWAPRDLDLSKVIEMLLLHDLVEIYAGDAPLYSRVSDAEKKRTEVDAAERLFGVLPAEQAASLLSLWCEFDAGESVEALYARAVDRLAPLLLNHGVGGGTWTSYSVDVDTVRRRTQHIEQGSAPLWRAAEAALAWKHRFSTGMVVSGVGERVWRVFVT